MICSKCRGQKIVYPDIHADVPGPCTECMGTGVVPDSNVETAKSLFDVRWFEDYLGVKEFDRRLSYVVRAGSKREVEEKFPEKEGEGPVRGWLITPISVLSIEEARRDADKKMG
jgi:hypothetical protein